MLQIFALNLQYVFLELLLKYTETAKNDINFLEFYISIQKIMILKYCFSQKYIGHVEESRSVNMWVVKTLHNFLSFVCLSNFWLFAKHLCLSPVIHSHKHITCYLSFFQSALCVLYYRDQLSLLAVLEISIVSIWF